jgi:hypothetical protein
MTVHYVMAQAEGVSPLPVIQVTDVPPGTPIVGLDRPALVTHVLDEVSGAVSLAIPVLIQALTKSTAGTSTALTLVKIITSDPETIQTTAGENFTVEGTTGVLQDEWLIHPQMGLDITLAFAQELVVIGAARLALVMTAPANVSVRAKIFFDE